MNEVHNAHQQMQNKLSKEGNFEGYRLYRLRIADHVFQVMTEDEFIEFKGRRTTENKKCI